MPPITLHMVLACRIADELGHACLVAGEGPFVLGATSPDIRVLTRQDRYSTHFFDLGTHEHQDSAAAFLVAYGDLAAPERVSPDTRAFVAGYISHLVMDEQYITGIYRHHFLDPEALGGRMRANVMDRLLQFDLDRKYGAEPGVKMRLARALACTLDDIDVGFIEAETLERWRQVATDVAGRSMDWDRARGMISNHLRLAGLEEGETLASFLDSLPDLLDETIAHITSDEIHGFVQRCSEAAARAVERYLACG
ncbi:MAG: hypothetical protein WEC33_00125 [Dehalococcoidia bacterium]